MERLNFNKQLDCLIDSLKLLQKNEPDNPAYEYLIIKLSNLSIDNLQSQKDLILHFMVDSYDGNIELRNKIVEFLSLHSINKKKA
jgi:hypothetical protein